MVLPLTTSREREGEGVREEYKKMSDEILKKTSIAERKLIKQVLEKARQKESKGVRKLNPLPLYSSGVVGNNKPYVVGKEKPYINHSKAVNTEKEAKIRVIKEDLAKIKIPFGHLAFLRYRLGYYTITFKKLKFALTTKPLNMDRRKLVRV